MANGTISRSIQPNSPPVMPIAIANHFQKDCEHLRYISIGYVHIALLFDTERAELLLQNQLVPGQFIHLLSSKTTMERMPAGL